MPHTWHNVGLSSPFSEHTHLLTVCRHFLPCWKPSLCGLRLFWLALPLLLVCLLHGVHFHGGSFAPNERLQRVRERTEGWAELTWDTGLAGRWPAMSLEDICCSFLSHFSFLQGQIVKDVLIPPRFVSTLSCSCSLRIFPLSTHLLWDVKATTYSHTHKEFTQLS